MQCLGTMDGSGCAAKPWRYSDFETSVLTFVRELDLMSLLRGKQGDEKREHLRLALIGSQEKAALLEEAMKEAHVQMVENPTLKQFLGPRRTEWVHSGLLSGRRVA